MPRVLVLLALLLAACDAGPLGPAALADVPLTPGVSRVEVEGDDGPVRFTLSVPDGLTAGARVPLVVALHWSGDVTPYYGETYLRALAAPGLAGLGAIVVAPDRPGREWDSPESVAVVRALTEAAVAAWPVDRRRVAVTGYSQGGFGTWSALAAAPDLFSAGIAMAAYPITDGGGRPVYVIHGTRDELYAAFDTERAVARLAAEGKPVVYAPAEGLTHTEPAAYVPALQDAARWLADEVWSLQRREVLVDERDGD
ncbi:prolyl oligopeptidase family serine peptidase [Rubrivirga marina]|uniref:Peptidase S9 prolyl oligopeptidase catalytic domain-containing protein n=1 Tax=Rubrivirga marina TaxID=1196024 RepID=A0A271J436_9BACT|nr:prolyl oligopeptidase family serine peptidase [Rubrivirga marina]PAP78286.1 hypothetical protein BSZ37_18575 [Rubrivirga marina]